MDEPQVIKEEAQPQQLLPAGYRPAPAGSLPVAAADESPAEPATVGGDLPAGEVAGPSAAARLGSAAPAVRPQPEGGAAAAAEGTSGGASLQGAQTARACLKLVVYNDDEGAGNGAWDPPTHVRVALEVKPTTAAADAAANSSAPPADANTTTARNHHQQVSNRYKRLRQTITERPEAMPHVDQVKGAVQTYMGKEGSLYAAAFTTQQQLVLMWSHMQPWPTQQRASRRRQDLAAAPCDMLEWTKLYTLEGREFHPMLVLLFVQQSTLPDAGGEPSDLPPALATLWSGAGVTAPVALLYSPRKHGSLEERRATLEESVLLAPAEALRPFKPTGDSAEAKAAVQCGNAVMQDYTERKHAIRSHLLERLMSAKTAADVFVKADNPSEELPVFLPAGMPRCWAEAVLQEELGPQRSPVAGALKEMIEGEGMTELHALAAEHVQAEAEERRKRDSAAGIMNRLVDDINAMALDAAQKDPTGRAAILRKARKHITELYSQALATDPDMCQWDGSGSGRSRTRINKLKKLLEQMENPAQSPPSGGSLGWGSGGGGGGGARKRTRAEAVPTAIVARPPAQPPAAQPPPQPLPVGPSQAFDISTLTVRAAEAAAAATAAKLVGAMQPQGQAVDAGQGDVAQQLQKARADLVTAEKELTTQKVESAMMTGAVLAAAASAGAAVAGPDTNALPPGVHAIVALSAARNADHSGNQPRSRSRDRHHSRSRDRRHRSRSRDRRRSRSGERRRSRSSDRWRSRSGEWRRSRSGDRHHSWERSRDRDRRSRRDSRDSRDRHDRSLALPGPEQRQLQLQQQMPHPQIMQMQPLQLMGPGLGSSTQPHPCMAQSHPYMISHQQQPPQQQGLQTPQLQQGFQSAQGLAPQGHMLYPHQGLTPQQEQGLQTPQQQGLAQSFSPQQQQMGLCNPSPMQAPMGHHPSPMPMQPLSTGHSPQPWFQGPSSGPNQMR